MKEWNPFSASQWIAWIGATIFASASLVGFAFLTFETKHEASAKDRFRKERVEIILHKLYMIEKKVDKILERE